LLFVICHLSFGLCCKNHLGYKNTERYFSSCGNIEEIGHGGSLNDLYRRGAGERTPYLISQVDALTRLATPTTIDPQAMIPRNALRAPRVMFYDLSLLLACRDKS
jgi:hypothetical protein